MFRSLSPSLHCVIAPNRVLLIILPSLLSLSLPLPPQSPPPPLSLSLPLCTCVCVHELNVFEGWGGGHQIRREDLAVALLPLASLLRSSPKSYFTVPSIRSLGSPQLPSPDAGLSPSLGTRTGHGERRHVTHISSARKQQTHLLSLLGEGPVSCSVCAAFTHTVLLSHAALACI